jgi:hypothetical protein
MAVDGDGGGPERRPLWLVLTADARRFGVEYVAPPGTRVRIVADPDRIADLLLSERPRLAIVEGPEAPDEDSGGSGAGFRRDGRMKRGALALRASSDGAILPVGNGYELDVAAHELRDAAMIVHLRPKEFQLLAVLAANPGRAFTRAQLIEVAWSSHRDVDPRTVDVHVHGLRAKIEPEPERPTHLVTIRGFGYRFDPTPR